MSTAWESLSDPVRRQIVTGCRAARSLPVRSSPTSRSVGRPVLRYIGALRESGVVEARPDAQRRVYSLAPGGLDEVREWVDEVGAFWSQRLDALGTELARGRRTRRTTTDEETP